jgi:hypothetical protein
MLFHKEIILNNLNHIPKFKKVSEVIFIIFMFNLGFFKKI